MRASILAGPDVEVIDVSPQGLLVESDVRLTPGAGICLNIKIDDQAHLVGGRVARVDAALSGKKVTYRAGIALDSAFAPFDLPVPHTAGPSEPAPAAARAPEAARESPREPIAAQEHTALHLDELGALRRALEDQRREQEHRLRVVDMLKAALRASEHSRKDADEAHKKACDDWEQQRRVLEEKVEHSRRRDKDLAEQAKVVMERERALSGRFEEERAAWAAARAALQQDLHAAKARSEDAARELDALRDNQRLLEQTLEEERAMLAGVLEEKERLLGQVEAARLETEALLKDREQVEHERDRGLVERQRLAQQLEVTENWCADQHELIYQLWQETARSAALFEGWQSAQRRRSTTARDTTRAASEPAVDPSPDGAEAPVEHATSRR